jgi:2'-5' RNA ligase
MNLQKIFIARAQDVTPAQIAGQATASKDLAQHQIHVTLVFLGSKNNAKEPIVRRAHIARAGSV